MAITLDDKVYKIRQAIEKALNPGMTDNGMIAGGASYTWISELYETFAIINKDNKFYSVDYTMESDGAKLGEQVEVERDWKPVEGVKCLWTKSGNRNNKADRDSIRQVRAKAREISDITMQLEPNDTDDEPDPLEILTGKSTDGVLVSFGGEVKALDGNEGMVGGYLVRFSSAKDPDLTGDFFTADTDFGEAEKTRVYYHHGGDGKIGKKKIGVGSLRKDAVGIWVDAQLDLHDEYEKAVYEMTKAGKMGWSSGTASHLVEREPVGKAKWIKSWPLGLDASLTPTPAEPRNAAVSLKTLLMDEQETAEEDAGDAPNAVTGEHAQVKSLSDQSTKEDATMSDNPEIKALEEKMTGFSAALEKLTKLIEDAPAVRKAGYYSVDGGKADPNVKSFGDFLLAVKRGDTERLNTVYNSSKSMTEANGTDGGWVVPEDYSTSLMQIVAQNSPILAAIERIPVAVPAGSWPALDQFITPTAGVGQTALAAGVKGTARKEGGAYTETEPDFTQIKWRVNSIGGYVKATKELAADSAQSLDALLRGLFSVAIQAKEEFYVLRGSGAGEPLGVLNSAAAIGISPDTNSTFAYADAVEMTSRFKKMTNKSMWMAHQSILPDFAASTWVLGNSIMKLGEMGYGPLVLSEHLPQADNSGCVALVDWGAYRLWVRQGLTVDFSEHADFLNGNVVWRFDERLDGQPWLKKAITQADPQGSFTVSPFVYFND